MRSDLICLLRPYSEEPVDMRPNRLAHQRDGSLTSRAQNGGIDNLLADPRNRNSQWTFRRRLAPQAMNKILDRVLEGWFQHIGGENLAGRMTPGLEAHGRF